MWCSKGTYIRVLAEDIGRKIGCGAHLTGLRRVGVAGFDSVLSHQLSSDDWCPWESVEAKQDLAVWLLPVDLALLHYPSLTVSQHILKRLYCGQKISANDLGVPIEYSDLIRLYDENGVFYALGRSTPYQGLMLERWMSDPL